MGTKGALVALLAGLVLIYIDWGMLAWSMAQMGRSVLPLASKVSVISRIEDSLWTRWETSLGDDGPLQPLEIPHYTPDELLAPDFAPNLSTPFVIRGMLQGYPEVLEAWGVSRLTREPLGEIEIDYFTDARRQNTVPDGYARLKSVVQNITKGGTQKFGTEMVFRQHPELITEFPLDAMEKIVGKGHLDPSLVGSTLTVPVFMGHGHEANTTRTDLHCEPIENLVLQLRGRKKWMLLPPSQSKYLRPRIGPDGRAYVFSTLTPDNPQIRRLQRYELETRSGDLLFVPTWTWHRVDYIPGETAFSASFFHVKFANMACNNPWFAASSVPNMIKELVGLKMQ